MWVVTTMLESVCLIFGSLGLAILLNMACWRLLRIVRHPELGALVIAGMAVAVIAGSLTHSPFLRMTFLFAAAGAVPLWIAGREWRANQRTGALRGGISKAR